VEDVVVEIVGRDVRVLKISDCDAIPVARIDAVEVYVGAATPLRHRSACGVIPLWTRRG
jgi:hypothetical protein